MEIFTRALSKLFQWASRFIELLRSKELRFQGISWIIWKITFPYLSDQRVKLLHNIMIFFLVEWIKTKAKTIVYANVSLHLRKCNCIVKKQSSLYKLFSNTLKVARQLFPKKSFVRTWHCFSNSRKCEISYLLGYHFFFYFLVNKKKKLCGTVMGQKIEYDFRFKKDSI